MTYEEQMAAFSGDPAAMQKVNLEHQLRGLEAGRSAFHRQQADNRQELAKLQNESGTTARSVINRNSFARQKMTRRPTRKRFRSLNWEVSATRIARR